MKQKSQNKTDTVENKTWLKPIYGKTTYSGEPDVLIKCEKGNPLHGL